jgi:hypothetical protein
MRLFRITLVGMVFLFVSLAVLCITKQRYVQSVFFAVGALVSLAHWRHLKGWGS